MIAALAYNPHRTSDNISVQVSGKIVDGNGTPLSNVAVCFGNIGQTFNDITSNGIMRVNSDDQGQYFVELSSESFTIPGKVQCVAWASDGSHWSQEKSITINDESEISLNFMLVSSTRFILPIGPFVIANTFPGLTQVKISTYLVSSNPPQSSYGFENAGEEDVFSYYSSFGNSANVSFNKTSDYGSLTIHGLGGCITGVYNEAPGNMSHLDNCWFAPDYSNTEANNYKFSNRTLDNDYVNPKDVSSQSTFYNLTYGENMTVSASPKHNVTLSETLSPDIDLNLPGLKLNLSVNCTYRFTPGYETTALLTITPLTPGIHEYQIFIEQGYIIHIWELAN